MDSVSMPRKSYVCMYLQRMSIRVKNEEGHVRAPSLLSTL